MRRQPSGIHPWRGKSADALDLEELPLRESGHLGNHVGRESPYLVVVQADVPIVEAPGRLNAILRVGVG